MSRLTRLSLANRTVVLLFAFLIFVVGLVSAASLKQETIPSTDWPASTIIAIYPGASPASVEQEVSKPIEDQVLTVDGVKSVTSISSSNTSQVTVEWEWGEDTDKIMADIRAAVDDADLPSIVEDPIVSSGSFDDLPVLTVAVTSDLSPGELSNQADDVMVPAIKDVKGVQGVTIAGDEKHEIDITFDIDEANRLGVDPSSIGQLFAANSKAYPSGTLRTNGAEIDVQTGRTYKSEEQIRDLEVQGEDGRVRLGDFATVEERPTVSGSISRVNGKEAVTLSITKKSAENTIAVSENVKTALDKLEKRLGSNTEFEPVFDQAPFIADSIHDLSVEGALGLLMAVLVILVFLRSAAPTFIAGVSIPLSLLFAMIGLFIGGYTLNIFTLGALTVAIGRVVDDSIVVIENIKRHQALGEFGMSSLVRSVKEVSGAVTSSTLTTVAVFAPITMVGGQAGSFFRPFALTVVISLLASLVISLTVVPVLASYIMRGRSSSSREKAREHDETDGWLQHAYLPVLAWTLKNWLTRGVTLLVAILLFAGTIYMAQFLKTDFIGAGSATNLQVVQTMPPGTGLQETSEAARRVEDVIKRQPNLGTYSTEIGGGNSVFVTVKNDTNKGSINIELEPGTDPIKAAKRLRADLAKLNGVGRIEVAVGDSETSGKVVVYVESPNFTRIETASGKVEAMMKDVKGLTNVTSDIGEERQMLDVDVDDVAAAELGMNQAIVGQTLSWAVRGEKIGEMTKDDTTLDVYLRTQEPATNISQLRGLNLPLTQRMIADAREDAGDAVEAKGDKLQDDQESDGDEQYSDGIDDLRDARSDGEEAADDARDDLKKARKRLADLREQLEAAQASNDPNKVSVDVYRISEQIEAVSSQIAQLSGAVAGSKEGADAADDQLEDTREQREKSLDYRARGDALDDEADAIEDLLPNAVKVDEIASLSMVKAASEISRVDGARAVTIEASSEGSDLSAITADIKSGLAELDLGSGVTARLGGVSEQQEQSFGQLFLAMIVAIGIVYLIMVATFRSLIQPLILLVSIPFAATGAIALSLVTDSALGIPSMIGMLMLIGIVVTNAIVLIDMINQKRESGSTVEESIMAGARLRVRPIVMTALATIFALLPMGLGITGEGFFISRPLAIVVIGGLVSSSILTLILVPVLYDIVEHRPDWLRVGKKRRAEEEEFAAQGRHQGDAADA